jgi:hypothetical protein
LELFDATVAAVADRAKFEVEQRRWTQSHELLAMNAELTHALLAAFISANSSKRTSIKPLRIKRPNDTAEDSTTTVSHKALMGMMKED